MLMKKLVVILASGSPRRVEILRGHGIEPAAIAAGWTLG
jgi:predicted house-cleaning NTP pyrophosphatase (Maf/HAM1 superfamily)